MPDDDTVHAATVASSDAHAPTAPVARTGGDPMLDGLAQFSPSTFEVGAELGRGGIGRVMRARDPMFDRPVAIKELLSDHPGARARFVREAMITARLQHPSIVPVYLAGKWPNGSPFYAMKLVEGQPLSSLVRAAASLDARIAMLPSLVAVCDAIAFAHRSRIIHRDLKPGNVLVGDLGETLVIDWGLAKDLDARDEAAPPGDDESATSGGETVAGSVFGTPAYMAPEQAEGRTVDQRADVYALGAMLYELLVGRPPYADVVSAKRALHVLEQPPTPIAVLVPGAPRDLVAIAERAMQRDPAARYADARDLVADLRRFTAGQLVSVREYGTLERLSRWARKHRAAVTVGGIAALITLTIGIVAIVNIVDAKHVAQQRAHEADLARAHEAERADAAVLARAQALVDGDPTAAVAVLSQLRGDRMAARPVAAEAASRGIAQIIGRTDQERAEPSLSDDDHFLFVRDASGSSGTVVVFDLTTGSRRVLTTAALDGIRDRTVYSHEARAIVTVDAVTGAQHRYASVADIVFVMSSPRQAWIAARTRGDTMVWNAATGEARAVPSPNAQGFGLIAVADDGTLVEVGPERREVWVTTPTAQRVVAFPDGTTTTDNLLASPASDGSQVAVLDRAAGRVHVLDVGLGTWTAIEAGTPGLDSASFAAGALFVYGDDIVRFTRDTGAWRGESLKGTRSVSARDQHLVGLAPGQIWVRGPERAVAIRSGASVGGAVVSRSGDTLYATLDDHTVRRWNLATIDGPRCGEHLLGLTLDGRFIAAGAAGELEVCDPADQHRVRLYALAAGTTEEVLDARGPWMLTAGEETVRWDAATRTGTVVPLDAGWEAAAVLANGRVITTSSTAIEVVDPVDLHDPLGGHTDQPCAGLDEVFHTSSGALVLGRRGHALVACDVAANTVIELAADAARPDFALADPRGDALLVHRRAHDAEILLWTRAGGVRALAQPAPVSAVAVSRDDGRFALVMPNEAVILDGRGDRVAAIAFPTIGDRTVAFSPSGDRLLVTDLRTDSVALYDVATGAMRPIPGAPAQVQTAQFADDRTVLMIDERGAGYRAFDEVPRDPAGFVAWLHTATNAVLDERGRVAPR